MCNSHLNFAICLAVAAVKSEVQPQVVRLPVRPSTTSRGAGPSRSSHTPVVAPTMSTAARASANPLVDLSFEADSSDHDEVVDPSQAAESSDDDGVTIVVDLSRESDSSDDDEVTIVGEKRPTRSGAMRLADFQDTLIRYCRQLQIPLPDASRDPLLTHFASGSNARHVAADVRPTSPKGMKCSVCLDKIQEMSSTPCGHIFW
eukprot:gene14808-20863_t